MNFTLIFSSTNEYFILISSWSQRLSSSVLLHISSLFLFIYSLSIHLEKLNRILLSLSENVLWNHSILIFFLKDFLTSFRLLVRNHQGGLEIILRHLIILLVMFYFKGMLEVIMLLLFAKVGSHLYCIDMFLLSWFFWGILKIICDLYHEFHCSRVMLLLPFYY